ncbi:MAG: anti-sigma factor [Nevskia sp.]|nr:anti-sigma factor [Nevskia sp.]
MKYQDAKLRRMLAAEYVLGTLRGPARRRFERLARADAGVRAEQYFWEAYLGRLGSAVRPVEPAPTVWISLQRRIGAGNTVPLRKPAPAQAPKPVPLWRIGIGLAAAATVAAVVILTQYRAPAPVTPPVAQVKPAAPLYVAQLKVPDSTMQWNVSLSPASGQLTVTASGAYPQLGQHSMELWWISPQGPVAIGLLPVQGQNKLELPKDLTAQGGITLAVSLEPPGGSPTGKPTGPVLTSGPASLSA